LHYNADTVMSRSGFIVIEGPDGSGKTTQQILLAEKLRNEGHNVVTVDFPQYETSYFGEVVGHMLNGDYGPYKEIHPRIASVVYAADRWHARNLIENSLKSGSIVLGNRYTLSNEAHQSARLPQEERGKFISDIRLMEYEIFNIPKPDLYLYLHVDPDVCQELILKKVRRAHLSGAKDELEADIAIQIEAARMYQYLADTTPGITRISCMGAGNELLGIDEIHDLVWSETSRFLSGENTEGMIRGERQG
jgi:dTMP kinase